MYAYGYQPCSISVTVQSEITADFEILPDFFDTDREKKEEEIQEFVRYLTPDLHPQIIVFIFVSIHLFSF